VKGNIACTRPHNKGTWGSTRKALPGRGGGGSARNLIESKEGAFGERWEATDWLNKIVWKLEKSVTSKRGGTMPKKIRGGDNSKLCV